MPSGKIKRYSGALIAFGFIGLSAVTNFSFSFEIARTPYLACIYGAFGILATLANAYIPLRILDAYEAGRKSVVALGVLFFTVSVTVSLVYAVGFASTIRDQGAAGQAALSANLQTTEDQLRDALTASKPNARRIDELREQIKTYRTRGALKSDDAQSTTLEAIGIPNARYYVRLLFAIFVELGSALMLFIAFTDTSKSTIPRSRA